MCQSPPLLATAVRSSRSTWREHDLRQHPQTRQLPGLGPLPGSSAVTLSSMGLGHLSKGRFHGCGHAEVLMSCAQTAQKIGLLIVHLSRCCTHGTPPVSSTDGYCS